MKKALIKIRNTWITIKARNFNKIQHFVNFLSLFSWNLRVFFVHFQLENNLKCKNELNIDMFSLRFFFFILD